MSLLKRYDSFLINNASQITAVESSLRSITYFLPGRFKDAELAGEAIYSLLNLLGLYHDSILVRILSNQQQHEPQQPKQPRKPFSNLSSPQFPSSISSPSSSSSSGLLPPSEHSRYTHHFSNTSNAYDLIARSLVIIGYLELLAEMVARRKLGRKRAWDVVVSIEAVKAALRISLVQLSQNRPIIQPPIPEREVDPAVLEEDRIKRMETLKDATAPTVNKVPKAHWTGSRTGYTRPTLASLRPGLDQDDGNSPERDHQLATEAQQTSAERGTAQKPLPLRTLHLNQGGSGSDSDDTLVDSTRLNASGTLTSPVLQQVGGTTTTATTISSADFPPKQTKPREPWTDKQVNDYLLSRTLKVNDVRKPEDLVRTLRGSNGKVAEYLWILRPLIYVLAIRKWGRKHTFPWALSLCLEYLARKLRTRSLTSPGSSSSSAFGNPLMLAMMSGENPLLAILWSIFSSPSPSSTARPISEVEEEEWSRRDRNLWWYLVRGPIWHNLTKSKLGRLAQRLEGKPILGLVGGVVRDYLPLVDEYYFYTAT
ncbi:peroxisome membrane protein [Violaceomyces palustris]|uniref:Peroxisome membrane protein n=1 Tax=Violaceomyces palustris TaxID=1673888 RepID=A0ACD0NY35_9BASI|nr:peroxisome membrane protein [Violaceomyces palustris]